MRRALALAALAALAAGCSGARPEAAKSPAAPAGPSAATVFEKKVFKLVKTPDPDLEAALEGMLSASYEASLKKHAESAGPDVGFTYSLSPRGAVYPFSEIEVSCILRERYAARRGPELCGDFYAELQARIKKAVGDRQ